MSRQLFGAADSLGSGHTVSWECGLPPGVSPGGYELIEQRHLQPGEHPMLEHMEVVTMLYFEVVWSDNGALGSCRVSARTPEDAIVAARWACQQDGVLDVVGVVERGNER